MQKTLKMRDDTSSELKHKSMNPGNKKNNVDYMGKENIQENL